ncbi:2OG-Fe(II) oxygenase [Shimia sp. R9_2]|uniref:2OG-Fe(II) oxygenase n=1 Tax=Shimia sp. R9_2 TaxID=2821112 RepID=UPI001AD99E64|nr:2OG-Fe(II) oxygenase [Shimia sp. R9_2]MBO9397577.1 2OG-Fe(II) oxygenase [Shimia sp. R9_2]
MPIPHDLDHLVFEAPNFLTDARCAEVTALAVKAGFQPATITTEHGTHVAAEIRNNDRVIFDDQDLARELWLHVRPFFPTAFKGHQAIALNDRFRVYRYEPGQFFDWHQDGAYRNGNGHHSMFTLLIYLNDGFEGGGTTFADVFSPHVFEDFTIEPATGKAVFFHHPLSHRGDPVITGQKLVLRTDVMFEQIAQ